MNIIRKQLVVEEFFLFLFFSLIETKHIWAERFSIRVCVCACCVHAVHAVHSVMYMAVSRRDVPLPWRPFPTVDFYHFFLLPSLSMHRGCLHLQQAWTYLQHVNVFDESFTYIWSIEYTYIICSAGLAEWERDIQIDR